MVRNGEHKCSNKMVLVDEKTIGEDENAKKCNSFKLVAESPRFSRLQSNLAPVHEEVSFLVFRVDKSNPLHLIY